MSININILSNFNGSGFTKLEKELKRLTTPMEKLGAVSRSLAPAAAIGLTAMAGMAVSAVRAAEEAQVANDRLDAVAKSMNLFGSQTDKVTDRLKEFAEANERSLAVDADIIKATQTKLFTFKNLAQTADEVGGAMDRATLAALDLAAAGFGEAEQNAVQLGKALQDPIKGITALARSGVTFTEQEKEKIKTLVETGKVLEAQNLILSAIETQVGGTAAATATGSAKMSLAFLAMQDALGEALMPVFEALVPLVTDFFGFVGDNIGVVTALAAVFGLLAVAILAVNFALNANPIVKVITLIAFLAAGVVVLINYLVELYGGWDKLFKDLSVWLAGFVNGFRNAIANIGSFFASVFNGIGNIAKGALNGILGFIEGYINFLISGINGLLNRINTLLRAGRTVGINVQVPTIPTLSIPRLAEGGIVMPRPGGVLANIAEGGQAEAVIPLDRLGKFGQGNQTTYNITVNGGISSGPDIGRSVVNAIRDFERQSGTAWRS
jgi:phage-related protein